MRTQVAQRGDFAAWWALAREVEELFGEPLAGSESFEGALARCIERGSAYCVREDDGPPGEPLLGGLLFSAKPPRYRIGWLVVAERSRRQSVGRLFLQGLFSLVLPPAEMTVVTFAEGVAGGEPARRFYESLGFVAAEPSPSGPDGVPRQLYRRVW